MKDLKIFTDNVEQEAVEQIDLLLQQEPFKNCKVRIMPDVHAGKGCVIGFTADLGNKVIPNIVGVDIGCGMLCVELGNIELDLEKLDKVINENVPAGRNIRGHKLLNFEPINELYCLRELKDIKKFNRAIGTLGGGNHFIEVDVDEDNNKYLVIHTGSRNLGKQVAEYYQELANQLCNYNISEYNDKQEKIIKEEFTYDSFVKINNNNITVVIESEKHDYELANKIIRRISNEFSDNKYITVKFN